MLVQSLGSPNPLGLMKLWARYNDWWQLDGWVPYQTITNIANSNTSNYEASTLPLWSQEPSTIPQCPGQSVEPTVHRDRGEELVHLLHFVERRPARGERHRAQSRVCLVEWRALPSEQHTAVERPDCTIEDEMARSHVCCPRRHYLLHMLRANIHTCKNL
jgi:hypothetical protein